MTQRIVVGSSIFSMVASAALVVMVGMMIHQQQQTNAALLEQISRLAPKTNETQPQNDQSWNKLTVRVTHERKDGPAGEGFQVVVRRAPKIGEPQTQWEMPTASMTDASGTVDCGYIAPGIYQITVIAPWHEQTDSTMTVHAGKDHLEYIVAPAKIPEMTNVMIDVNNMPDALQASRNLIVIQFENTGTRNVADRIWKIEEGAVIGDSMPAIMIVPNQGVWVTEFTNSIVMNAEAMVKSRRWTQFDPNQEFTIPASQYSLKISRVKLKDRVTDRNNDTTKPPLSPTDQYWWSYVEQGSVEPIDVRKALVAELGKLNHWAITMPDDLTQQLRAFDDR